MLFTSKIAELQIREPVIFILGAAMVAIETIE